MEIDDTQKPYSIFDQGPDTEAQLKQTQHGMGRMIREYTGNPVGYVEYGGQMLPYPSVYTGERMLPVEHATLMELQALDQAGVTVLPPEDQMGDPNSYAVGSGAMFRQANVSLVGSVQPHQQQGWAMTPADEVDRIYQGRGSQQPFQGYAPQRSQSPTQHLGGVSTQSAPVQAQQPKAPPDPVTGRKRFGWGIRRK